MLVEYELRREDYAAFCRETMRERNRKAIKNIRWRSAVILIGIGIISMLIPSDALFTLGIVLIIAGVAIFLTAKRSVTAEMDNLIDVFIMDPLNEHTFSTVNMTLTEEGIIYNTPYASTDSKWESIVKMTETEEHFFLYISTTSALIIPKKALCMQADAFRELIWSHVPTPQQQL